MYKNYKFYKGFIICAIDKCTRIVPSCVGFFGDFRFRKLTICSMLISLSAILRKVELRCSFRLQIPRELSGHLIMNFSKSSGH